MIRVRQQVSCPPTVDLDPVATLFAAAPCTRADNLRSAPLPDCRAPGLRRIIDSYPLESTAHRLHLHGSQTWLD